MKNFSNIFTQSFFIFIFSTTTVFASCPVDDITGSCNIAEFRQKEFVPTYSSQPAIDFNSSPEARLKPSENLVQETLRDFAPKPADFNYNSSCQFGVCNTINSDPLFLNR